MFGQDYSRWGLAYIWMIGYIDSQYADMIGYQGRCIYLQDCPRFNEAIEDFVTQDFNCETPDATWDSVAKRNPQAIEQLRVCHLMLNCKACVNRDIASSTNTSASESTQPTWRQEVGLARARGCASARHELPNHDLHLSLQRMPSVCSCAQGPRPSGNTGPVQ